jgi:DNA-directed RNA polymerase subunit alpha
MGTRIPLSTVDTEAKDLKEKLEMSTAEIGLSVRTTNCLEERGIFTVQDLLNCTREDLLAISNFGEKTLEEVFKALDGIGFHRGRRPAAKSAAKDASHLPTTETLQEASSTRPGL